MLKTGGAAKRELGEFLVEGMLSGVLPVVPAISSTVMYFVACLGFGGVFFFVGDR
jgi:hypothetical protein